MKAWRMTSVGAPDVLTLTDMDMPVPAAGEVLIRVTAAGFNPIDTKIRAGIAAIAPDSGVLGCDVSGVVAAVSDDVTGFRPGDAVFGMAGGVKGTRGALAEYMTADARLLARAPGAIPLAECAALPVAALTADAALKRLQIRAGDGLFICGASGAVGLMTTQMAVQLGCQVQGSAGSAARVERVARYGGQGILHSDCAQRGAQGILFPKVLDTFGGPGFQMALELAGLYGQVATTNARAQYDLSQAHAKALTLHAIFILLPLLTGNGRESLGQALASVAAGIDAGTLQGLPVESVGMSDVAAIHSRYEKGELPDKVVMQADF